ncbi:MAG: 3-deoxy-D-manno-octulosonate 8-phosphate phosphatase (KDO 8-P phosphatase) [Saprospiraceae bacterium]|jgi:3-deoxy-D-manno-octulosonate 8-phosphate phosphatase (KDO 8-P phosphatase)
MQSKMNTQQKFERLGATFLDSAEVIAAKLMDIRCFVFDWDGVFNNGEKANAKGSPFSEPDSMGLNMLRFSYWLIHKTLPITAIITGENNLTALDFAKREHLDAICLNAKNKKELLIQITNEFSVSPKQTLFVYDDILDLNAAEICHLSFCVKRDASPLFNDFIIDNGYCNYITGNEGGKHAVREIAELLIGLNGNYKETISKRMESQGAYKKYLSIRNSVNVNIQELGWNT